MSLFFNSPKVSLAPGPGSQILWIPASLSRCFYQCWAEEFLVILGSVEEAKNQWVQDNHRRLETLSADHLHQPHCILERVAFKIVVEVNVDITLLSPPAANLPGPVVERLIIVGRRIE